MFSTFALAWLHDGFYRSHELVQSLVCVKLANRSHPCVETALQTSRFDSRRVHRSNARGYMRRPSKVNKPEINETKKAERGLIHKSRSLADLDVSLDIGTAQADATAIRKDFYHEECVEQAESTFSKLLIFCVEHARTV